jgi:hypothetical protein
MKRRWPWLLGLGALLVLAGGWAVVRMSVWPARRHLPRGAVVIEEKIQDDLFLPDFTYEMTARMSAGAFVEWMAQLKVPRDLTSAEPFAYGSGSEETCGTRAGFEGGIGWFRSWCD